MNMALWGGVHVDVNDGWDCAEVRGGQSRLLEYLAHRGIVGTFAFIDVAAGLNPHPDAFVFVQNDSSGANNDRRRGHVDLSAVLGERTLESFEFFSKGSDRDPLLLIDRRMLGEKPPKRVSLGLGGSHPCSVAMTHEETGCVSWARACFNGGRYGSPSVHPRFAHRTHQGV